ncbi:hypothetical protein SAMN05660649_03490 [Desulfotomaculum arcticum]|uniref:Polyketide cyclase / dehydrase and lipid transport n=1 Tax=Desulfotruncus arcticus DSM 17038 TaxID=1121424 RepID=A0A1I2WL74_9FIRM|nr:hypothetical protein [Desulfotruncus arcticus]SFH00351.1 hypothetical protein SAMN05660649_03490 [Desulfotomaculum arcticum] [Desulfotruncus arcticus DSM 17038]
MEAQQMVTIAQGAQDAVINLPMESIDLATWFFTLKDEEYAACSSGHNGMVQGRLPNGNRVSVSVETIGGDFIVNNFIEDVSRRDYVRAVSFTVAWTGGEDEVYMAPLKITWELKLTSESAQSCMLTSSLTAETADMKLLSMLQEPSPSSSDPLQEHFIAETPRFAADIERKARMGIFD